MSDLNAQFAQFKKDVKAAASKMPSGPFRPSSVKPKSNLTSGRSTPIPAAAGSITQGNPMPPFRQPAEVFSQPANTGMGENIRTQVVFAIDYLRDHRDSWISLDDMISYLSKQHEGLEYKIRLKFFLERDEKVEYNPKNGGIFRFKPIHNIRNADELLSYLQNQTTAAGLSVRDLRDGWPDVDETINKLDKEGMLLVNRNKKDQRPRMIWPNDPSLRMDIDQEFVDMWRQIHVPDTHEAVVDALERAGLAPASKNKAPKANKVVKKAEKKKKPRKGGKKTNTHMDGLLRDYSHLQK